MTTPKPRPRRQNMIRALSNTGYSRLGNKMIQDGALSPLALAIGVYCLSQVPHWEVSAVQLAQHFKCGRGRILTAIKLLCRRAYCARRKYKAEDGQFDGMEHVICDDPARIMDLRFEWNREGRPADDNLDSDLEITPRPFFAQADEPRAVNETAIDSNERNKSPPYPPRAGAPPRAEAAVQKPDHGLGVKIDSPSTTAMPEAKNPVLDEASPAPVATTETGSAREAAGKILKPVTFDSFRKLYEPHKDRNMRRAEDDWNELAPGLQLHAHGVLPQYFAHMARIGRKPDEAWKYLRLKAFRQYPLPRAGAGDPEEPKARPPKPTAEAALATPIGLRSAQEGWAPDLADFVRVKGRMPEMDEIDRMEREGLENTLKYLEALGQPGHALGPYARQFLHKRWTVTLSALKANKQREPTFEEFLEPAKKRMNEATAARGMPPLPFMRTDARMDDEIPI